MKALILSGGSGTRLRPLSHSMPKQLIPLANTPMLEYVLASVRRLGVTEAGIVVGEWADEIAAVLGDGDRFGLRLAYLRQPRPLGLAHAVRLARPYLGNDDFVLYLGDVLLTADLGDLALEFQRSRPAAHVLVQAVADPSRYGVVEFDRHGRVSRLLEKPDRPPSDLALVGVYFFSPAIHRAVATIRPGPRGELELTDAIQWLLAHGQTVTAGRYRGFWRDTGRPQDVLECNRLLLAGLDRSVAGEVDRASAVIGPVLIEPGARVLRSRIDGPVMIGAGSRVEDCHLGPDVAVGRNCTVRGTRLADSIVMDGASVSSAGAVRGSLIGRHATVGRAIQGAHHRLLVGDHVRIEMAP